MIQESEYDACANPGHFLGRAGFLRRLNGMGKSKQYRLN